MILTWKNGEWRWGSSGGGERKGGRKGKVFTREGAA